MILTFFSPLISMCFLYSIFQKLASGCLIVEVIFAMIFAFTSWFPTNSPGSQKYIPQCLSQFDYYVTRDFDIGYL